MLCLRHRHGLCSSCSPSDDVVEQQLDFLCSPFARQQVSVGDVETSFATEAQQHIPSAESGTNVPKATEKVSTSLQNIFATVRMGVHATTQVYREIGVARRLDQHDVRCHVLKRGNERRNQEADGQFA